MSSELERDILKEFNNHFKSLANSMSLRTENTDLHTRRQKIVLLNTFLKHIKDRLLKSQDDEISLMLTNLLVIGEILNIVLEPNISFDYTDNPNEKFYKQFNKLFYEHEEQLFDRELMESTELSIIDNFKTDPIIFKHLSSQQSSTSLELIHHLIKDDPLIMMLERIIDRVRDVSSTTNTKYKFAISKVLNHLKESHDSLNDIINSEDLNLFRDDKHQDLYKSIEEALVGILKQKTLADAQRYLQSLGVTAQHIIFDKTFPSNDEQIYQTSDSTLVLDIMRNTYFMNNRTRIQDDNKTQITGNADWILGLKLANAYSQAKDIKFKPVFDFMCIGNAFYSYINAEYESIWNFLRKVVNMLVIKKYIVIRKLLGDRLLLFEESVEIETLFYENCFKIFCYITHNNYDDSTIPSRANFLTKLTQCIKKFKPPSQPAFQLMSYVFKKFEYNTSDNKVAEELRDFKNVVTNMAVSSLYDIQASKPLYQIFYFYYSTLIASLINEPLHNDCLVSSVVDYFNKNTIEVSDMIYIFEFIDDKELLTTKIAESLNRIDSQNAMRKINKQLNEIYSKDTVKSILIKVTSLKQSNDVSIGDDGLTSETDYLKWVTSNPDHVDLALDQCYSKFSEKLLRSEFESALEFYSKYISALVLQRNISPNRNDGPKTKGDEMFDINVRDKLEVYKKLYKAIHGALDLSRLMEVPPSTISSQQLEKAKVS